MEGEDLVPSCGCLRLELEEPFYIGIGVCSNDSTVLETDVKFKQFELKKDGVKMLQSTLETINIESTDRRLVYNTDSHIEAPNWTADGATLIYNSNGLLYKIPISGGNPKKIDTDFAIRCNNDHGVSPDSKNFAFVSYRLKSE